MSIYCTAKFIAEPLNELDAEPELNENDPLGFVNPCVCEPPPPVEVVVIFPLTIF